MTTENIDAARGVELVTADALERLVQEVVHTVCAEVLGVERLLPDENLLDAGAQSMHVMQITSRLEMIFDVDVSWRAFFEKPTLAHLAAMVTSAGSPGAIARVAQAFISGVRPYP